MTLAKLLCLLFTYSMYEKNWDGDRGMPATFETVRDTVKFLALLPGNIKLPFSGLSSNGDVHLFWDEEGVFIDISFTGDNKFSYSARDAQGKEFSGDNIFIGKVLDHTPLKDILGCLMKDQDKDLKMKINRNQFPPLKLYTRLTIPTDLMLLKLLK